jgi:restriction-modification enzyme MmeI-like protein
VANRRHSIRRVKRLRTCAPGAVTKTLAALKASPATAKAKARFILATDGADFEAEDFDTGETVACAYADFPDHFGFFLPLAGITTVKQVRESSSIGPVSRH